MACIAVLRKKTFKSLIDIISIYITVPNACKLYIKVCVVPYCNSEL